MTEDDQPKIAGLLLAAGGSTRFGSPKQLAEFEGESLIRRAAKALIEAGCDQVMVVLGAEIDRSSIQVADLRVSTTINLDWETGMSSSIRCGLSSILELWPEPDGVLISLCDQPAILAEHLSQFIKKFAESGAPIIASEYENTSGVPALFSHEMFPELLALEGDKGARDLIRNSTSVVTIDLREVYWDIDTKHDLVGLRAV